MTANAADIEFEKEIFYEAIRLAPGFLTRGKDLDDMGVQQNLGKRRHSPGEHRVTLGR
jgi:hypothetical protein